MRDHEPLATAFETRLARDLSAASAVALRPVDGSALARELAAAHPRRRVGLWRTSSTLVTSSRTVLLATIALVLVAVLLAAAVVGRIKPAPVSPRLHIAYVQGGEVFLANADGTHQVRLTDAGAVGRDVRYPRWHGSTLTFGEYAADGSAWLGILDHPAGAVHLVRMPTGDLPGSFRTWSAPSRDGRWSASLTSKALAVAAPDGRITRLGPPAGYAIWDTSDLATLDWAPDGSAVLVGACSIDPCFKSPPAGSTLDRHDLFLVPVDGSAPTRLSGDATPAWHAVFSPDGGRIAYQGCRYEGPTPVPDGCDDHGFDLGVMRRDGTDRRRLDGADDDGWAGGIMAWWSDDSSMLAYQISPVDEPMRLAAVDVGGSAAPVRIAGPALPMAWAGDPRWPLIAASDPTGTPPSTVPVVPPGLEDATDIVVEGPSPTTDPSPGADPSP